MLSRIEGGARLVTLTGPGGTGKTRLALEAATSLVPEYKAGVFWVGLASLRDPTLVTETISQALGAKDGLAEHIAERELLLLLDNLEQVIESAPDLASLMLSCPNLTVIVTSRELLRISGEVEYAVPPLAEPEAVSLFCARAHVEPGAEIAELCARLDSLPLAVELAAARVKALSPRQILERLSQRLDLFKGGRDSDPRQQTLRATIEWSYDLLAPEEQQLFARLSVFAGGCTLEAAQEVCDADVDTLQSLVEKSLLRFTNERYWMLETIRDYAGERLEGSEAQSTEKRHAEWVLHVAEEAERDLRGPEAAAWFERLPIEMGNVRVAREWSLSHDKLLSLRIAVALWRFWPTGGYWTEASRWLEAAWSDDAPVDVRLQGLRARQAIANATYDNPQLVAVAEERRTLARASGDRWHESGALMALGNASYFDGDLVRTKGLFAEALEMYREIGASQQASDALGGLGLVALEEGDLPEARKLFAQNLGVSRAEGNEIDVLWALSHIGQVAVEAAEYEEASRCFREAFQIATQIGDLAETCDLLERVAFMADRKGLQEDAALLSGAAAALHDTLGKGDTPAVARRLVALDEARSALGDEGFEVLHARGRVLEPNEAVELALRCLD